MPTGVLKIGKKISKQKWDKRVTKNYMDLKLNFAIDGKIFDNKDSVLKDTGFVIKFYFFYYKTKSISHRCKALIG